MKLAITSLALAISLALTGCDNHTDTETSRNAAPADQKSETAATAKSAHNEQDQAFETFKEEFIEEMWRQYPTYALYSGYYKYDSQLPVPDQARQQDQLKVTRDTLEELHQYSPDELNAGNATDYYLIENALESSIWNITEFKPGEWNPASYNVAGAFGLILNTDYKPLDERLMTISERLGNVPAYYEAAKANITTPTLEHTQLAIQQNQGALGVFGDTLMKKVADSGLSDEDKAQLESRAQAAQAAINDYLAFLTNKVGELKANGNARSFRIGEEMFNEKFELDIVSDYSAEEIYQLALQEKDRLHAEMIKLTGELWPKYMGEQAKPEEPLVAVKQLIDKISVKHVKRDEFVEAVRAQIPELTAFVNEHDLLTQDPEKPLVVRETPEYQRGVAGASINAPGPYDPGANTYYNVTPLDHYTDEQAESYLREYNHYILQILNIHEAIPGHYTQLVHSNKSPSLIKALLGSGAMVEGWAVYTERMMLEEGYGNNEPELWLMWYKWNLRVVVNAILDHSIHVLDMSREDAMDLMVHQAFQQQAEAEGKWRRATLSSVQLSSYFTGYKEIYDFREQCKQAMGDDFNLKDFHNKFLSFGSTPVKYIKKLMPECH